MHSLFITLTGHMSLTIAELKSVTNPAVVNHLGVRVVRCELTGFPCKRFAALPVANKADSTKVTWRGAFVDYECALAYAASLVANGKLEQSQFEIIKAQIQRKLGFLPAIPEVDINQLYPRGSVLPETIMNSYVSATSLMQNDLFAVPDEKPKNEKPPRYDGFEVNTDKKGALTVGDDSKPAFQVQNVAQLLVPWEKDPEQAAQHCYSWLVTLDGTKPHPEKVTVTEYATPKQAEQFHGKAGDKKGTKVRALVLKSAPKPAKVVTAAETKIAERTKAAEAAPAVGKKRKVATA